jgi:hypothetical protein
MTEEVNNDQSEADVFERIINQGKEPVTDNEGLNGNEQEAESLKTEDDVEELKDEPKHKVVVDGQEFEVPLKELLAGYQRQEDYTRKTQEVARASESVTECFQHAQQGYTKAVETLSLLTQIAESPMIPEHELLQLALTDPEKARRIELEQRIRKNELDQVRAHRTQLETQQKAMALEYGQRYLTAKAPHLLKPETKCALAGYLEGSGYSKEEIANVFDPRSLIVAEKAMKWDEMQKKRAEVQKSIKPTVEKTLQANGKAPTPQARKVVSEERNRLRRSGSLRDAAPVFKRFV